MSLTDIFTQLLKPFTITTLKDVEADAMLYLFCVASKLLKDTIKAGLNNLDYLKLGRSKVTFLLKTW